MSHPPPDPSQGPSVLIAEDEPLASMALSAQMEALGYHVLGVARDGHETVALGRCLPLDVAIVDMKMPGRTGLDAASELFGLAPTPVVLLTGFGTADLPSPIPRPPVFAVLTKPVGLAELRAGLDQARERFRTWMVEEGTSDMVRRSMDERQTIARAILEGDPAPPQRASVATDLIRQAVDQDTSPITVARQILDRGG